MRISRYFISLGLSCLLVSVAACGGSGLNSVTGKVTYKNEPAKGAAVIFHKIGAETDLKVTKPSAGVREDGSFEIMTDGKVGVAAGDYAVTIHYMLPTKAAKGVMGGEGESHTPEPQVIGPFTDPKTTPHKVTVKSGSNVVGPYSIP